MSKNNNYQATTGSGSTYVETTRLVDPKTEKLVSFINEKAYHNVDVSTGWEISPDGKVGYSLDIDLEEYDSSGGITIMYSPEAIIPRSNDRTCDRDNFPEIKTIEMNKLRLYAKEKPNAENMPRITIRVSEIGTNVGSTGARERKDQSNGLELEETTVSLNREQFSLPLNREDKVLRRTTIKMIVTGKKGDKNVSVSFGNLDSENFFRNMDGSSAKQDSNKKEITFEATDGIDSAGTLEVTIPKDYHLKNGLGYFIIPVTVNRRVFWLYANLYSEEHEDLSKEKSNFFIYFPRLSRSTSKDTYFIDGEVFARNLNIVVQETRASGYVGSPNGTLRIFDLKAEGSAAVVFETGVVSGTAVINNLSRFNDYDELKIVFFQEGEIKAELNTKIVTREGDVEVVVSENALTPIITSSSYVLNSLKVNLYSRFSSGLRDIYYGYLKVTTDDGTIIYESAGPSYTFSIPQMTFNSKTLPYKYNIEVYQKRGMLSELIQRRVIVIHKEGDLQIIPSIEVTPASMVLPVNKDQQIIDGPHTFKVRVKQQGEYLDLRKWSITLEHNEADLKIISDDNGNFLIESFKGRRTFAEVVIKVSARGQNQEDFYTVNYGITKNNIMDSLGDFVYVKYGTSRIVNGERIYSFTVDPTGQLPDGEMVGPYYGITATDGDGGAPKDPRAYIWTWIETKLPVSNEQEALNNEFYMEGPTSIYLSGTSYDPELATFSVESVGKYQSKEINWSVRNIANGKWIDFSKEDLVGRIENNTRKVNIRFSNKLFDQNQKMSIRAIVKADTENGEEEFPIIFNTFGVRSQTLFAEIETKGEVNKRFHVFPIDRNGDTIMGTKRSSNPVILEAKINRGRIPLRYSEEPTKDTYTILEGPYYNNCSLDVEIINGQYTLSFDYISGKEGSVRLVFGVGIEQRPISVQYFWKTKTIADKRARKVDMILSTDNFTINSATPAAMTNWSEVYKQYEENFVSENSSGIKIYFDTVNTNVKRLEVQKDFNNVNTLGTSIQYLNDTLEFFPINLLSKQEEKIYANIVPNETYIIVATNPVGKKIKFIRADDTVVESTVKANHVFVINGNQRAIILKAPAGAERILLEFEQPLLRLYLLPLSNSLKLLLERRESYDENILLTHTDTVRRRLPRSYSLNSKLAMYKVDEETLRGYILISPQMAVNISFFSNTSPDMNTNIYVESITGESQIKTIRRVVRNYQDLTTFETQISTIAGKENIVQQDISYLANSREAIRVARESIISQLGEGSYLKEASAPSLEYIDSLFERKGETYPLLLDKEGNEFAESNESSILGFHMMDDHFNLLKFKLRYSGDINPIFLSSDFKIYNKTLLEKFDDESSSEFSSKFKDKNWKEFTFLIPPAAESLESINLELEKYLIKEGLVSNLDNIEIIFQQRKNNKSGSATYYLDLNISHLDPGYNFLLKNDLEMKDFELFQLNLSKIEDNKINKRVMSDAKYEHFKRSTLSYIGLINEIESKFKQEKTGMLKISSLSRNLFRAFEEVTDSIESVEALIAKLTHQNFDEMVFQQHLDGVSYTMGIANSVGMISSLQITPEGTILKGEKNQVIGSTSIGNLYGKKIIIGKEITPEDIAYDKELIRDGSSDGTIAIWDEKRWASVMNKKGQYYLRYNDTRDSSSLVGYMVMDPSEIAAYQFDLEITSGFGGAKPIDVTNTREVGVARPVFQIDKDGIVNVSKLNVGRLSGTRESVSPTIDLMDRVRIESYESEDNLNKYRRGIVFLSINEGGK